MKKQSEYFPVGAQFTKTNPDVPLYILSRNNLGRRQHLELMRFLFSEEMKAVNLKPGIGCFSKDDRDAIEKWFAMNMFMTEGPVFADFSKMYNDIRDADLRIAKFDIFYGFKEEDVGSLSDEFVNFYCSVIDSMSGRFYAVKQPFGNANYLQSEPDVWMFYFENENDHMVFSSLVDLEIEAESGLFKPAPKKAVVVHLDLGSAIASNSILTVSSLSTLQFSPPPKAKLTGKLTHNPDGTVTLEEV